MINHFWSGGMSNSLSIMDCLRRGIDVKPIFLIWNLNDIVVQRNIEVMKIVSDLMRENIFNNSTLENFETYDLTDLEYDYTDIFKEIIETSFYKTVEEKVISNKNNQTKNFIYLQMKRASNFPKYYLGKYAIFLDKFFENKLYRSCFDDRDFHIYHQEVFKQNKTDIKNTDFYKIFLKHEDRDTSMSGTNPVNDIKKIQNDQVMVNILYHSEQCLSTNYTINHYKKNKKGCGTCHFCIMRQRSKIDYVYNFKKIYSSQYNFIK